MQQGPPVQPPAYRAPRWLPGGHLQTSIPTCSAHARACRLQRERWDTPDGDFIDVDWLDGRNERAAGRAVPRTGGQLRQPLRARIAARRCTHAAGARAVPHFRGCSGEPNRLPRAYHSGDYAEIDWILRRLAARSPRRRCFAVGVSLGGNALLKWLAHTGEAARHVVARAAAVSAPLDLTTAGHLLGRGLQPRLHLAFPELAQAEESGQAATLPRPLRCARRRARPQPLRVRRPRHRAAARLSQTPTTTGPAPAARRIAARPRAHFDRPRAQRSVPAWRAPAAPHAVSACVELEFPKAGGHAGFISGPFPGNLEWLPRRIPRVLRCNDWILARAAIALFARFPRNGIECSRLARR